MTSQDRLARRVEWALSRVRYSNGYADTANQVVEALSDLFPGEVEAARRIQALEDELREVRQDLAWARLRRP
ncbi:Uncharacterised protein [Mycobacteroides abscessus subsp. abscessus]|uniref:Uncharacterized protein n=1 Tax=Mycobacteroides abscessus subsp. abscessus TaxID=1185650 RepID=A0AB38CVK9_9MYCO|nr:Uncharacterised protein [Mycobacteroides abscessus subsp. abscessus]SIA42963.1 Uncharacterised protein [Mycobacteroides abscessus subsp. abscessus]SIA51313.1 Uncharacterised protein [Mycobacteroides abscessus subsp. abscessus]SIA51953.1 Uncharacterised protein [Mycobacteroides abscessus subsp. abscessus]SKP55235.1 Uncharacterised protein [Mycobacteroides abscessus subsp. abscessus]